MDVLLRGGHTRNEVSLFFFLSTLLPYSPLDTDLLNYSHTFPPNLTGSNGLCESQGGSMVTERLAALPLFSDGQ